MKYKKIAISRIDRMGDMILTLPIIKSIKQLNPSIKIHIYGSDKNIKVLKDFKYVDKIINFDQKGRLVKEQYDLFLNFSPGWKSFFLCLFSTSTLKGNLIFKSRYKNIIYSKLYISILSYFFFNKTLIVDRLARFKQKQSIHQTEMMFELLDKFNIVNNKENSLEIFLPRFKYLISKKKICVIHLTSKWINYYYDEKDLLKLILILEKNFTIALTTDETTKKKFKLVFNEMPLINNKDFEKLENLDNKIILDNLEFKNWVQVIYASSLVITPECGCTHIAAICKINTKIIYDPNNMPDMIHKEYYPWKNNHEKFIFNNKDLNNQLTKNL